MKYDCSWKKSGKNYCIYNLRNESEEVRDPDFHTALEKMYDLLFDLYEDGEAVVCIDKKPPRNVLPTKYTQLSYFSVNESAWASVERDSLWDTLKSSESAKGELKIDQWTKHPEGGQTYFTDGICSNCGRLIGNRSEKVLRIVENLDKLNGAFLRELPITLYSKDFLDLLPNEVTEELTVRKVLHAGKREFFELLDVKPSFVSKALKEEIKDWRLINSTCESCGIECVYYFTNNGLLSFFSLDELKKRECNFFSLKEGTLPSNRLMLSSKIWDSIKDKRIVKSFEHERVYFAPEEELLQ